MTSVNFIVALSLFNVVTAEWNKFHGHIGHHYGSQHFANSESPHFGSHNSHQGSHYFDHDSAHFGSPYKYSQFRPPHELPHFSTHHESPHYESPNGYSHFGPPYGSSHYGHTQQHQGHHFGQTYYPRPHAQPPWERPDWDRPELGTKDYDDSSSSSSTSSEDSNKDQVPGWHTLTTAKWSRPTTEQPTTTGNTYTQRLTTLYRGAITNPSTASTVPDSNSSIVDGCVVSCKNTMTPEYNPVCGTNSVTYQNIGMLLCAKECGVDVALKRTSMCPSNNTIFDHHDDLDTTVSGEATETTQLTTSRLTTQATPRAVNVQKQLSQKILNCMLTCPFNGDFSPVCGTDFVTYFNHDRLMCAKKCGVDVELRCWFPCATSNCHIVQTTTTPATTTTTLSWNLAKTRPPWASVPECLSACLVSDEYNPVCGTNEITYSNPSKLQCAQLCGVDVRVKHQSICHTNGADNTAPPTTTTPTTTTPTTTAPTTTASATLRPFTVACMRACLVTPEYNPVCGTNHVTYTNLGKLECASMCGVDVKLLFHSACEITNPNDFTESTTNINDAIEHTTTSDSTIEQSLLDTVFGKATATTQTVPTTEEVFDIDPRFNHL